jgi:hypothetical protein
MPNDEDPTASDRAPRPVAAGVPTRGPALVLLAAIAISFLWPVPLLTAPDDGMVGCYTSGASGVLTADRTYGTALIENEAPIPVMWPHGYSGRRSGSQVEIVDTSGHVVARTGTRVQIGGGYTGENPRAFLACGSVIGL